MPRIRAAFDRGRGAALDLARDSAWPLVVYAISRAMVFAAVGATLRTRGPISFGAIVNNLGQWDGAWYIDLARDGYPGFVPEAGGRAIQSTLAFFPAFPAAMRAVHWVTGVSWLVSGVVVANLFGGVATVLLRNLVRRFWGEASGRRAALLFCFFPGAFVLSMIYAEALMISAVLACLLALSKRWWFLAGVFGAVASASRPNGLVVAGACAWAAFVAIRNERNWRSLFAPLIAPLGFVAAIAYIGHRTGEAGAWFRVEEEAWAEHIDYGAKVIERIGDVIDKPLIDLYALVTTAGLVFAIVTLVLLVRMRPPGTVLVYAVGMVVLTVISETLGLRPRFLLTAFPLIVALAHRVRGDTYSVVLASSAAMLAAMCTVTFTTLELAP